MANRPTDEFDPRDPTTHGAEHDAHEPIDDQADFGGTHRRAAHAEDDFDDADFVEDDMNDVIDDGDPLADLDEEHEDGDHAEDDERDTPAPAPKSGTSKGALIFYGLMALLVLGGGYFMYRSLFPATPKAQQTAAPVDISSGSGNSNDLVVSEAAAPTPAPTPASNSNPMPTPEAAPNTQAAGENGWQTTLPPAAVAGTAPNVPATAPVASATQPAPVLPNGTAPATATALNTEALAGLNAHLSDTDAKLAQIAASLQQLAQVQSAQQQAVTALQKQPVATVTTNATTAPPVDLSGLRSDIASLQKQVGTLAQQQAQPTIATKPAATVDLSGLRSDIAGLQKQMAQLKTQTARASASPTLQASSSRTNILSAPAASADTTASEGSPKTRPVPAGKNAWVLRAATPGMAWVSPAPSSAELRRVVVGDRLDGIGAVTAIRQDNGHWIVEGANGTIR